MAYFGSLGDIDIGSISAQLGVNAVDVFIYDTSKDSDGGAWRKRTQGTSWYNETLNTATRGSRREFPAVAVIVAENNKVTIYDGDDPSLPMWMVFNGSFSNAMHQLGSDITIAMLNGQLIIGSPVYDLSRIDFVGDRAANSFNYREYKGNISTRNNLLEWIDYQATWYANANLVSRAVNDVAITVLPNAPIDPTTGLPIPTIAVATAGGVSVIKDDGTVANGNLLNPAWNINFDPDNIHIWVIHTNTPYSFFRYSLETMLYNDASGKAYYNTYPYIDSPDFNRKLLFTDIDKISVSDPNNGFFNIIEGERVNLTTHKDMLLTTTSSYVSGWMPGDIKGAFLADTDDTDIVGSGEIITNGGFDTGVDGWTVSDNLSVVASNGNVKLTTKTGFTPYLENISQSITGLVVGKRYSLNYNYISGNRRVRFVLSNPYIQKYSNETTSFTFVATSTSTNIQIFLDAVGVGENATLSNISLKASDADRSVNDNGLIVSSTEYEPDLDLLFTTENYTVNNQVSDFESALTHTRNGMATMVDSTGRMTFAPNNLLRKNNDFTPDGSIWFAVNGISVTSTTRDDPDGGTSASTLTAGTNSSAIVQYVGGIPGANAIVAVWIKRRTGSGAILLTNPNSTGSVDFASTLADGQWHLAEIKGIADGSDRFQINITILGDEIDIYEATFSVVTYETTRRAVDTVRTTSDAYYGPRLGHHTWDGSNWVNSGLLLETETRSNYIPTSETVETKQVYVTPQPYTLSFNSGSYFKSQLSQSIAATAVDVFIYDTKKDSDGGAWRTGALAQASSWYNETLNTATRGSRQEFPEVAVIVAESNKVTIYDGDDPSLPMWMVFNSSGTSNFIRDGITSVAMINGLLSIGDGGINGVLATANFMSERMEVNFAGVVDVRVWSNIANRNTANDYSSDASLPDIVNRYVNDIAMTVLSGAPTDPTTGMKVPTIAVATNGGVSVIKDDGTVVDITGDTGSATVRSINIDSLGRVWITAGFSGNGNYAAQAYFSIPNIDITYSDLDNDNSSSNVFSGSSPVNLSGFTRRNTEQITSELTHTSENYAFAFGSKLSLLDSTANSQTGMVAYTTSTYNTGWMPGDIKGAFLADTDDTDIVGSGELVDNGGFDTDGGWILGTGWSITGGVAKATGVTSDTKYMEQNIGLVAGKLYRYEFTTSGNLTGTNYFALRFGGVSDDLYLTQAKTYSGTIVASGSGNLRIRSEASTNDITIDNISVQVADADRSVNDNGLIVSSTEYEPDLDLLFTTENYTVNNQVSDFESALTHTRDSNATMVDSDGLLKWAPHNLQVYSDDLTDAAYTTDTCLVAGGQSDPDGGSNAFRIDRNGGFGIYGISLPSIGTYTRAIWAKTVSGTGTIDLLTRYGERSPVTVTDTWQLFEFDAVNPYGSLAPFYIVDFRAAGTTLSSVIVYAPHAYRSDLGGMVDNPDRGDSYVPTTSSARYLPRRGHHTWDGSNWVNSGLLLESEARTNLFQYSEDFVSDWIVAPADSVTLVSSNNSSPIGNVGHLYENDTDIEQHRLFKPLSTTAGTTYTFSLFAKAATSNWIYLLAYDGTTGLYYGNFDLENGTASGFGNLTIEPYGDGWYRCAITFESQGGSNFQIHFTEELNTGTNPPSFAGTGKGAIIAGAQLEEGSTPSSYIPTPGSNPDSTATRTAETLTVPAANMPWPTPNVIGPELVDNGGFIGDSTTGWTLGTGWSVASEQLSHVAGTASQAYYNVSLTAGKVYEATCDVIALSGGTGGLQFRNGGTTTSTLIDGSAIGSTVSVIYVAEGNLSIAVFSGAGTNITVDNISVREIDPLSVSIQMEGNMTYADNGTNPELIYYHWFKDSQNRLLDSLSTSAGGTGGVSFFQEALDVPTALSAVDSYSPGILVPYNIASRHGSTFINGAINGTALTADTTPTALPDLSSTDLQLGYDYMGTIKRFRVFDEDIADTGIEKATSYQPLIKSVGTITRTPVATGAELMCYEFGGENSNYLLIEDGDIINPGAGDFCFLCWYYSTQTGSTQYIFEGETTSGNFYFARNSTTSPIINIYGGISDGIIIGSVSNDENVPMNEWLNLALVRRNGALYLYINGVEKSVDLTSDADMSGLIKRVYIGNRSTLDRPFYGKLSLMRFSATAPTLEQIQKIYNDEKVLFEENAKCTLYGSSDAVTALAHDADTDLLHVGTSAGRSVFKGLRRIDNTTTAVDTAISAVDGFIVEE